VSLIPNDNDDVEQQPLSPLETLSIVMAGHIGVRKAAQREEDFNRAHGLRIFFAAATYFALIVLALIVLVRWLVA
jgi:hypothetical protein